MNENMTVIFTSGIGGTVGLLLGHFVTWRRYRELRGWWRRRRDGVQKADVIAAIEAAALAQDLRLAWSLSDRYRLERCSNCVQRIIRRCTLRWVLPVHNDSVIEPWKVHGIPGIPEISARDKRFDSVGICDRCWLKREPPKGWFCASIVP